MRHHLVASTALAIALTSSLIGTASGQTRIDPSVMSSCSHEVGQMKFEGYPADRNREMMMLACTHNNGVIPGGGTRIEERPASLQQQKPRHQRSAPAG